MKNITVAIEDEVYRNARIVAAKRDTSVSALVRDYLAELAERAGPMHDWIGEQDALLESIRTRRHGFSSGDNLPREAIHQRQ